MTENKARYNPTQKDVLISFQGSTELKDDIEKEAERLNISKRDMFALLWKNYTEAKQHPGTKRARATEEAQTNMVFKIICGNINPHLSNKEIVEIIEIGSEDKPIKTPVTKTQVAKWKSSLNRIKKATGNSRGGRVPMYKEMPQDVFQAFLNGLTIYMFDTESDD